MPPGIPIQLQKLFDLEKEYQECPWWHFRKKARLFDECVMLRLKVLTDYDL